MRASPLLLVMLLAGCATSFRTDPSKIQITVERPTEHCGESDNEVHAKLRLKNNGLSIFKIWVLGPKGPPFELNWLSYEVLKDGLFTIDHGPGGHGPVPASSLQITPGDFTFIAVPIYSLSPDSYGATFSIRFEDQDGNKYTTESFSPCVR